MNTTTKSLSDAAEQLTLVGDDGASRTCDILKTTLYDRRQEIRRVSKILSDQQLSFPSLEASWFFWWTAAAFIVPSSLGWVMWSLIAK